MENNAHYNTTGLQFELEVTNFINNECSEKETFGPFFYDQAKKMPFYADGYLPKGCKALGLDPKSIIEVKYRVLPDTISRWAKKIQSSFYKYDQYNFVLIHNNSRLQLPVGELKIDGYRISIINFDELKKRSSKSSDKTIHDNNIEGNKNYVGNDFISYPTQEEIFENLKSSVDNGNLTLFLGAGVSVSGGLPSWPVLLENLVQEINPTGFPSILSKNHISKIKGVANNSSIIMARYMRVGTNQPPIKERSIGNNTFNLALHKALYSGVTAYSDKPLINSIASLIIKNKIKAVITYNFDDYLETKLSWENLPYQTIADGGRLEGGNFPIYHVHGLLPLDPNDPNIPNPVLTEESYHRLYQDAYQWSNVEQIHALNNTTCVFIGLSMTDPNLRRLMEISMMKNESDNKIAPHFVFLRKTKFYEDDSNPSNSSSQSEDEENRRVVERMLHELGANIIWYDKHDDLPNMLNKL